MGLCNDSSSQRPGNAELLVGNLDDAEACPFFRQAHFLFLKGRCAFVNFCRPEYCSVTCSYRFYEAVHAYLYLYF